MRLNTLVPTIWPLTMFSGGATVKHDADALIRVHAEAAVRAADLNALHEDLGFRTSVRPGHWGRVAQEVRRRSGVRDEGPRADFAPTLN